MEERQRRCDYAINYFKEVIGSIDSEQEKVKGVTTIQNEEEEEVSGDL